MRKIPTALEHDGHMINSEINNMVKDLTGRKFGHLTVIGFDHINERHQSMWLCECDCEDRTHLVVRGTHLTNGNTTSCGCVRLERLRKSTVTHGMSKTPLYKVWQHMRSRCENKNDPKFYRYGGRGITVCDEWCDFGAFKYWALNSGYSPDLQIDRINNDDGYYPENCRWADNRTQMNNTGRSHYITYSGVTHTIADWARIFGIKYSTLSGRISRNDMRDFEKYFNET